MDKNCFKKILPYLLCILAFVVIAYAYAPQLLTGKVVNQSDISSWQGMSNEIVTYNNEHPGERTLWTNSMFGGMPATSISVIYKGDYTQPVYDLFFTGERPASYLLISLIGGFLLFLAFGVNYWLAFLGAIAITFCSYNMQIIQVGHNSKMVAIAFMPWVLASVVYAYRKCGAWGSLFFAFALSFQIKANHPQITYYLAIIILGYAIWQLCAAIKEKVLPRFIKVSLMLLVGGLLGIATNINHLLPTYEYAQHTMRGGSELADAAQTQAQAGDSDNSQTVSSQDNSLAKPVHKTRKGLDLDYATQWSYGIDETVNLLIPNYKGGVSKPLGTDSNTYRFLVSSGYDPQTLQYFSQYWGPQPFTAGPMYMGAICVFLFVLGFFVLKGGIKWWIGGVSLLALMLGWGYHFMPASELFFNYAPMYNKFRTVSMIITILQITVPILAVLAVNQILNDNSQLPNKKRVRNAIFAALGITGGFCLLVSLFPSIAGSFISEAEAQIPPQIMAPVVEDRIALLKADAIRSLLFILLGAIVLWLGYLKRLKPVAATALLALLVLVDLWSVDKRYLNDSHFVTKSQFTSIFMQRPVDKHILMDKDPDYRVLDLSVNTFNDAYISYFHKTIGGYSAAKLQRYQDLIDNCLVKEIPLLNNEITAAIKEGYLPDTLSYYPVLSMLNAKYIVKDGNIPPVVNHHALGNAWFVKDVKTVNSAPQEMEALKSIDPAVTAVVNKTQFPYVKEIAGGAPTDSTECSATGVIELEKYSPNRLVYRYSSPQTAIALFSEVYYSPGWRAWIADNSGNKKEELKIFRANWILRGVELPAGEGNIIFEFAPESFSKGEFWSKITSGLLWLLLACGVVYMFIARKRKNSCDTI